MAYKPVPTTFYDNGVTNIRDVSLLDANFAYTAAKVLSVDDFGAVGDGVTDDTAAFTAAFAHLAPYGGTVTYSKKYLINANLTIPEFVSLKGPSGQPATQADAVSMAKTAALIINSAATITVSAGAGLDGCMIYRKGMTFPAVDASAFAGTAITISSGGDSYVRNCQIMGFNQAITGSGCDRSIFSNLRLDNVNGIAITATTDVVRLESIHNWPYATQPNGVVANNIRTGKGFYLHDTVDESMLVNCFVYGYAVGYHFLNISNPNCSNCNADNTQTNTGSIGWLLDGSINSPHFSSCSSWGCDYGIKCNANAGGGFVDIFGFTIEQNAVAAILVSSGDADIYNNFIYNCGTGLLVSLAASVVRFDFNTISTISPPIISASVATTNVFIGNNNRYVNSPTGALSGTNCTIPVLASAASVSIYTYSRFFNVTGTTTISALVGGVANRLITLQFTSAGCGVTHSTTAGTGIFLSRARNYSSLAGSTLTLFHDGVQWWEVARTPAGDLEGSTTPTVTASAGTITTVSCSLNWTLSANRCSWTALITLTTNGTGSGQLLIPLPFTPSAREGICGIDTTNLKGLAGVSLTTGSAQVTLYDGTYPGADGHSYVVSGGFETNS